MAKSDKKKTAAWPRKFRPPLAGRVKLSRQDKVSGKSKKTPAPEPAPVEVESDAVVLDRLFTVVESRRNADPAVSHSARLLSRGPAKVAQKFGEEAVECLIEAVAGNRDALIAESADVLYHLLVLWVSSGVTPSDVWAELIRREGVSGITEKAARTNPTFVRRTLGTSKIP
jgi:phosphoribosyl-ATP pyrophosphohydrolase